MASPYLGQILIFGGNFAIRGWALCDGQLLAISQNSALFSLLGTTYGGDGRTTFGLPELRGRVPVHVGSGPGLFPVTWGQKSGANTHTLTTAQLPAHNHAVTVGASDANADTADPSGRVPARAAADTYSSGAANRSLGGVSVGNTGSGQSFSLMQPYLGIYFLIALQGNYPSRN